MIALIFTFVACSKTENETPTQTTTETQSTSETQHTNKAELTDDEIMNAAEKLFTEWNTLRGSDYAKFEKLYRNTPKETIDNEYNYEFNSTYDNSKYIIVAKDKNSAIVNVIYYIVTGNHPDTRMIYNSLLAPISLKNGAWKIDYSDDIVTKLNEQLNKNSKLYPQEFFNSKESENNAAMFSLFNYMYIDSTAVYEGCSNTEIKFASQNDDGSVDIVIWIANGTNQNIYYEVADVSLEDENLGTIVNLTDSPLNLAVKAKTSTLYTITIPANNVQTGTQKWSNINSRINVKFD